jgi:hypothetical protein
MNIWHQGVHADFRQPILQWQRQLGLSDNMVKAALADQAPGAETLW